MTALAFVLLDKPLLPAAPDLIAGLRQRTGRDYHLEATESNAPAQMPATTFHMDGQEALIALMDVPVPWQDLEGPSESALWSKAKEVCLKHTAHLVVALRGEEPDSIAEQLRLTDLVGAVVAATEAPAVYWGAARMVHPGGVFRELAALAERESLPLHLWVDLQVFRQAGGERLIATVGLKAFGLMEIEGSSRRLPPKALRETAFNIAHYLMEHGNVLKDGDTVGGTERERIPVRHRESELEGRGTVIWLDFDGAARPGFLSRLWQVLFR